MCRLTIALARRFIFTRYSVLSISAGILLFFVITAYSLCRARFEEVILPVPQGFSGVLSSSDALKLAYEGLEKIGEDGTLWIPEGDNRNNDKTFVRYGPVSGHIIFRNTESIEFIHVRVEATPSRVICKYVVPLRFDRRNNVARSRPVQ